MILGHLPKAAVVEIPRGEALPVSLLSCRNAFGCRTCRRERIRGAQRQNIERLPRNKIALWSEFRREEQIDDLDGGGAQKKRERHLAVIPQIVVKLRDIGR